MSHNIPLIVLYPAARERRGFGLARLVLNNNGDDHGVFADMLYEQPAYLLGDPIFTIQPISGHVLCSHN